MAHKYKIGEKVVILYGYDKDKEATIVQHQVGLVYKVVLENENIVYYSEFSLKAVEPQLV